MPASELSEVRTVRVRDLQVGDVTLGSGATILHRPYVQCRTPARKRVVELRRKNGTEAAVVWGADTTMKVRRPVKQLSLLKED